MARVTVRRVGLRTSVKVLQCEVLPASAAAARHLAIAAGTPVPKAVRVRATRDGPLTKRRSGLCSGCKACTGPNRYFHGLKAVIGTGALLALGQRYE